MKLIVSIALAFIVNLTHAQDQPLPKLTETLSEFINRYTDWIETVPEQDRAWPQLIQVDQELLIRLADQKLTIDQSDESYEFSLEFAKQNQNLIDDIIEYSKRPYLGMLEKDVGFDGGEPGCAIGILLPQVQSLQTHSTLLMLDAINATRAHDHDRAIECIQAIFALGNLELFIHCGLEILIQNKINEFVAQAIIQNRLNLSNWSVQELTELRSVLSVGISKPDLVRMVRTEEWLVYETVTWMYSDHPLGGVSLSLIDRMRSLGDGGYNIEDQPREGRNDELEYFQLRFGRLDEQYAYIKSFFNDLIQDVQSHPHQLVHSQYDKNIEYILESDFWSKRFAPTLVLPPDFTKMFNKTMRSQTIMETAHLLVSLQLHKVQTDSFPTSLSELDEHARTHIPIDPFTGKPVHYTLVDDQFIIYSLGQDRDDDNARPLIDDENNIVSNPDLITLEKLKQIQSTNPQSIDGDWVLYPSPTND